jgi:nitrogen-specific signal transduction histidine kinase
MNARVAARRVVHISDSPDESQLLAAELANGAAPLEVARVASRSALRRELEAASVDLVIADLPFPWSDAHDDVSELQRTHPEVEVIFRWGEPGARNAEPESAQIERLVNHRIAQNPVREQNEAERRAMMRELARRQDALLRLQRRPLWDFEGALRDATRAAAELLDVERVSVWEFTQDRKSLECAMLFQRTPGTYERGALLVSPPRYLRALESSLTLVAHDCQRDPRTSDFAAEYLAPLGIPSLIDSPVRVDGEVVGVLCIEHVGEPRHWSILDQCAASTLASHISRAYEVRRRRDSEQRLLALERLDALGRVAGHVAHDFNNRLTVLSGWIGLLRHDLPAGSATEHCLTSIESELDKATRHVRELLALGQGGRPAKPVSTDLRVEVERQAPTLKRVLGDAVNFEIEVEGDAARAPISAQELDSVLINLATNARDALRGRGAVKLTISCGEPPAALPGSPGPTVRLNFEDDGPGFSDIALAHAFEPLFTTKPPGVGSGLGLSSVARMVRMAGGTIQASNRRPHGARIEIELPRLS